MLHRTIVALVVALLFAGCTQVAAPVEPASAPAPVEMVQVVDAVDGSWTFATALPVLGGVAFMGSGGWPQISPPASFVGGNATFSWSATPAIKAIKVIVEKDGEPLWSEQLDASPTTVALAADDPRVLGATHVRMYPILGEAGASYAWAAEFVYETLG